MCGRFALNTSAEDLTKVFQIVGDVPAIVARYNVAPSQAIAAVRRVAGEEGRRLVLLKWGLVPAWAKDPEIGARMINARAESAAEKPSFRDALKKRRCLIPASGFYEWREIAGRKVPHFIQRSDLQPLAFAGLWESWRSPDGASLESCTILTTEANDLLKPLHDRMPVILDPSAFDAWLDPTQTNVELLKPLLRPFASEALSVFPVSLRVNSPKNDDPSCIEPAAAPS